MSLITLVTHQRWLRFGIRDRLSRWWHNPDTAAPEAFDVPFFGYRYRGNFSTFIDWSVFYFGAYSEGELLLMRDTLKNIEKPIIFDVGGNVGHHTLFAASIASSVHSFEPYDVVGDQLWDKVKSNGIQHVTLHRVGLGSENQYLQFDAPTNCNTGTGKFVPDSLHNDDVSGGGKLSKFGVATMWLRKWRRMRSISSRSMLRVLKWKCSRGYVKLWHGLGRLFSLNGIKRSRVLPSFKLIFRKATYFMFLCLRRFFLVFSAGNRIVLSD